MMDKIEFTLKCFRSAREEIIVRVKSRDNHVKYQLFAQAVLLGLTEGIKLGGVESKAAIPHVAFLAIPISLIFWVLYFSEDRLVGQLSAYCKRIIKELEIKNADGKIIDSWDGSIKAFGYMKMRIVTRVIIHIVVFFVIPLLHMLFFYQKMVSQYHRLYFLYFCELALLSPVLIFTFLDLKYRLRRTKALRVEPDI
jgi:hypothetical protein